MIRSIYKFLQRMPNFRGRHRVDALLRRLLETRPDELESGLKMHLDVQEWTQISLLSGRPSEPETAALIEDLLATGDCFIDIGAHVGSLSLIAARRVGNTGQVVAVDPQPYNCERILSNALLNGFENILVVPAAMSDTDRFIQVAQQSVRDKARLTLRGAGVNDTPARFLCACLRLDTIFDLLSIGSVKLVKIDVEGFEQEVLQGAPAALGGIEHVIYETLPGSKHALNHGVAQILEEAGFALHRVDGTPWRPGEPASENNVWARRPGRSP